MAKSPAFQYYPKDHIASKAGLLMDERGAWTTLVDHCWEYGAPIPMSLAVRLVGEKQIESLRFMLRIEGDTVTFDWLEETRKKQAERAAVNAENGKKGGRGNTRSSKAKSERKANALRTKSEKKPFRAADAVEDEVLSSGKERAHEATVWPSFDDFYDLYDRKRGRPNAEAEWAKIPQHDREAIMQAVPAYIANNPKEYRKDPERYLKLRTWEDEVIQRTTNGNGKPTDQQASDELTRIINQRYGIS